MSCYKDGYSEEQLIKKHDQDYGHLISNCAILNHQPTRERFTNLSLIDGSNSFSHFNNGLANTWLDTMYTSIQTPDKSNGQRTGGCIVMNTQTSGLGKNTTNNTNNEITRLYQQRIEEFIGNNDIFIERNEWDMEQIFNLNRKKLSKRALIDFTYNKNNFKQYLNQKIANADCFELGGARQQGAYLNIVKHNGIGINHMPECKRELDAMNAEKGGAENACLTFCDNFIKGNKFSTEDLQIPDIIGNQSIVLGSCTAGTYASFVHTGGGGGISGRVLGVHCDGDKGSASRKFKQKEKLNRQQIILLEVSRRFQTFEYHTSQMFPNGQMDLRNIPLNYTLNSQSSVISEYYHSTNVHTDTLWQNVNWPSEFLEANTTNFKVSLMQPYDIYWGLKDIAQSNACQALKSKQNRGIQHWSNISFGIKILRQQSNLNDPRQTIQWEDSILDINDCIVGYKIYQLYNSAVTDVVNIYKKNSSLSILKKKKKCTANGVLNKI
eukprot:480605_1